MRHQAIFNLYKDVIGINDSGALDVNGAVVSIDEVQVTAEIARLQDAYDAKLYQRQRAQEYPPIGDQLDALWKGGDSAAEMLTKVQAVKTKYPKPS